MRYATMVLPQSFYNQSTLKVAQDLLGCFLVRTSPPTPLLIRRGAPISRLAEKREGVRVKIVETEAYNGPNDLASHASKGRTARNEVMFGEPGIIYVYFTYGMHWMLNIVTEKKDYPAAVLIRAVEPVGAIHELPLRTNGPARLTKALQINKSFNGLSIYIKKHGLWIEDRKETIKPSQIKKTTRIGVDYAKEYKDKKWRYYIKDSNFISRK